MRLKLSVLFLICLAACGGSTTHTGQSGDAGTTTGGQGDGQVDQRNDGGDGMSGSNGGTNEEGVPMVAGCPLFTAADAWNQRVDAAAVDSNYTARLSAYLAAQGDPDLHPDFGAQWEGMPFGIPYNVVPEAAPKVAISFEYADESDPGPYPFPDASTIEIEGGDPASTDGDRHVLVVEQGVCALYEAWA